MTFYFMLLAHLLYDFHWQGPFIAENKGRYPFLLMVHALTWAMLLCVPLLVLGALRPWHLTFLFASHFLTDQWKSSLPKTPEYFWAIYVDQGLHFVAILVAVML